MSASEHARYSTAETTKVGADSARRLSWPAATAAILLTSAALWALILQSASWLGLL